MLLLKVGNKALQIDESAFLGKGTVGTVYPHPTDRYSCVKVYEQAHVNAHAKKVAGMIASPPAGLVEQSSGVPRHQATWPNEMAYANGAFAGFTMPKVEFGETWSLTEVLTMAENDDLDRRRLLSIAINLSSMVSNLHKVGHYVIDFNPGNFRVYKSDSFVVLLDCDGFQIRSNAAGGYYPADVAWPDMVAPFVMNPDGSINKTKLNEKGLLQDNWGLSTLTFRLLNRNIFPYDGLPLPGKADQIPATNPLRIAICNKLYAYGSQPSTLLRPLPHSLHTFFPPELGAAFYQAFGQYQPISADALRTLLIPFVAGNRRCPKAQNHWRLGSVCEQCSKSLGGPPVSLPQGAIQPTGQSPTPPINPPVINLRPPQPPTKPAKRVNLGLISVAIAVVFAAGWLIQRVSADSGNPKPPYPINNFTSPIAVAPTMAFVNLRRGPGASYPVVKKFTQSEGLTAYGTANSTDGGLWDYVKLSDGTFGYVNSKLVQVVNPVQAPAPAAPAAEVAAADAQVPSPAQPTVVPSPAQPVADSTPPPPPVAQIDEAGRARQIVTSTNFYHDMAPDSGEIPGQTMVFRVDANYQNAQAGDVAQGVMMQNGQVVNRCNPVQLQTAGNFWCRIPISQPGDYQFILGVNGVPVASHDFLIHPPAQQGQAYVPAQQYGGQQPVNGQAISNALQQLLIQQIQRAGRHPR